MPRPGPRTGRLTPADAAPGAAYRASDTRRCRTRARAPGV